MITKIFGSTSRGILFAAAVSALALVTSPSLAVDEGGPVSGVWNSNIGAVYEVWQYGDRFLWWSDSLNETAMGRVQGSSIHASWSGKNGDGSGVAVVKNVDSNGRAHRIEWSNGVVFSR